MRNYEEMMNLILKKAQEDERIRALTMEGSRVSPCAQRDQFSDFDICFVVRDIREFTRDKEWVKEFGEILIMQCPDDWYKHPYDYDSHDKFTYLIQYVDGNRIDLTLIDVRNIASQKDNREPRMVLINKDGFEELIPIEDSSAFYVKRPSEQEYFNTCNEFRWVSLYISKGLCRKEFYYAKGHFENICIPMLIKMLNWKIGIQNDFQVTTGNFGKYFKKYLSEEEMTRFQGIFPNGDYEDMWEKLFLMYDYFAELASFVAENLGFPFDEAETEKVRNFQEQRRKNAI